MKIEFIDKRMIPILNHQFKIIGENITFEDINEFVEIGKKKVIWYEYYLFKDKNQYEEWKEWALKEMKQKNITERFDKIDMIYGLNYKIKPIEKGQLKMW